MKRTHIVALMGFFITLTPYSVFADFPAGDSRFNNYAEMTEALDIAVAQNPKIAQKFSIGKTIENRNIWAVELNGSMQTLKRFKRKSAMPGVVFLGNQRAREHLSAEIPLMFLQYLIKNYGVDQSITELVNSRDIFFIPMVNPDGAENDTRDNKYWDYVKNMRPMGTSVGVDLGSNYGYGWGGPGSSEDPANDVYRGPFPFSEPETRAVRDFFQARTNIKVSLNLTSFGEKILYPWFGSFSTISKLKDYNVFTAVAQKISEWNKYQAMQASEYYIASGDFSDWAYDSLGVFAFTLKLSPQDTWAGGFYPGAGLIDKAFEDNLKPMLYLIDLADNPYKVRTPNFFQ